MHYLLCWFISVCPLSLKLFCYVPAPSKPPSGFTVNASTSSSVTASWQLPPADSRNGIIRGFKLFINRKGSDVQMIDVSNSSVYTKTVTGLQESTEYELQVLAYTSAGDGPQSSVQFVKTKEYGKSYLIFRKIDSGQYNLELIFCVFSSMWENVLTHIKWKVLQLNPLGTRKNPSPRWDSNPRPSMI